MIKQAFLRTAFDLIFVALFNAFFFVIGGVEHNATAWISYGFIHFAYLMFVLTRFFIRKGKSVAVFSFSLYSISLIYFFAELITGTVFIIVSPESYKAALLVQLSIAALYGVMLTLHMLANERTANAEEKRHYQIAYVKGASAKLRGLLEIINDKNAKRNVEKVYDAVYSSPAKSHPNLTEIENRILTSINELERAVAAGNNEVIISTANALLLLVNERNNLLRSVQTIPAANAAVSGI